MRFPVGGVAVGRQSVEGKTDGRDRAPLVLGGRGGGSSFWPQLPRGSRG